MLEPSDSSLVTMDTMLEPSDSSLVTMETMLEPPVSSVTTETMLEPPDSSVTTEMMLEPPDSSQVTMETMLEPPDSSVTTEMMLEPPGSSQVTMETMLEPPDSSQVTMGTMLEPSNSSQVTTETMLEPPDSSQVTMETMLEPPDSSQVTMETMLEPPDSNQVTTETMLEPPDSSQVTMETMLEPPDSSQVTMETMLEPPDSSQVTMETMLEPPDSSQVTMETMLEPPDSSQVTMETMLEPPDSSQVTTETMLEPPDSSQVTMETMLEPPDSSQVTMETGDRSTDHQQRPGSDLVSSSTPVPSTGVQSSPVLTSCTSTSSHQTTLSSSSTPVTCRPPAAVARGALTPQRPSSPTETSGPAAPGLALPTVAPVSCHAEPGSSPAQTQTQTQFIILDQQGQTLQCERMVIVTSQSEGREVYVIPSNQLSGSQLLLPGTQLVSANPAGPGVKTSLVTVEVTTVTDASSISRPPAKPPAASSSQDVLTLKPRPPDWALRLRSAEKLGDSYRGYCSTELELEAILLLHKQQTGCVFGTRQSPSLAKPATRLMWKSQYVPYDGIPFVNAGSRAIVMECQYGPRRKGKKNTEPPQLQDYKATCPARIYIKKVRKFPEFRVPTEPTVDRKTLRREQERAFSSLRNQILQDTGGAVRYYLQLPTEKAHLYHDVATPIPPPPPDLPSPPQLEEEEEEEEEEGGMEGGEEAGSEGGSLIPSRLHPRVAERIRDLVAEGQHHVYSVRKQLRHFVERELVKGEELPERHNLRYFPTVNDIKNHIHESQKALGLMGARAEWRELTPTLPPSSTEVVLDGRDTEGPEAVQLFSSLSSLQPKSFSHLQLQPVAALPQPSTQEPPPSTSSSLDLPSPTPPSSPSLSPSHPMLLVSSSGQLDPSHSPSSLRPSPHLSPSRSQLLSPSFLQASGSPGDRLSSSTPQTLLGLGQMVSVSPLGDGGTHQIILENGQTIPVQILHPESAAWEPN